MPDAIPYPAGRNLDTRLAYVRQEAHRLLTGEISGHVEVHNTIRRIKYTLEGTRWTQRRYPHFTLTEQELDAIHRVIDCRWQSSGERTTTAAVELATALASVGLAPSTDP